MQSEHVEDERNAFINDANAKFEYIVVGLILKTIHFHYTQMRTSTLSECKIKHTISKAIHSQFSSSYDRHRAVGLILETTVCTQDTFLLTMPMRVHCT